MNFRNKAIKILIEIAKIIPTNCKWTVFGSTNMLLQSIDLKDDPEDIDILTTQDGLAEFYCHFKKFVKEINCKGVNGKNYFQEIKLIKDGIEIGIMTEEILPANQQFFKNGFNNKFENYKTIPLMKLELQIEGMKQVLRIKKDKKSRPGDRAKKIEILEKFLNVKK